jgi:methionyl-tRNA formyltransferase
MKMYKKVLVISDNAYLAKEFEKIIEKQDFSNCTFTFGVSPFSIKNDFDLIISSKVEMYDLKKESDVEAVMNNHDLVFSIHCKQIFPKKLVDNVKCINVHPGYNPINRGWYPQVFAIIENLPVGATIHEIDNELDHGNIIAREFVPINKFDTSFDVYNRVTAKEIELLDEYLKDIINNQYETIEPENSGNIYLKKDFNNLLELNLEEESSFGVFIDRLRALSHGEYKNAYFLDPDSGKKIYVNLSLAPEDEK